MMPFRFLKEKKKEKELISVTLKNLNLSWCYHDDIININFILVGEKLQWFQSHLDPNKTEYTKKEACELIEE